MTSGYPQAPVACPAEQAKEFDEDAAEAAALQFCRQAVHKAGGQQFKLKHVNINEKPCVPAGTVELNLGHSKYNFLSVLLWQLEGEKPTEASVKSWLKRWYEKPTMRRIDVALLAAEELDKKVKFTYRDPWERQVARLARPPAKKVKRDVGCLCMFFFHCGETHPGPNKKPSWCNTHPPGMVEPDDILFLRSDDDNPLAGYYNPQNAGWWYRELLDARYAGLQFFLLNAYGGDIRDDIFSPLKEALEAIEELGYDSPVKIAMFDDTWKWGQSKQPPFNEKIDCNDTEDAVNKIFEHKWKPFFKNVPERFWYRFKGKPLIYFYNGGGVRNVKQNGVPFFTGLRQRFKDEFNTDIELCVDSAFWCNENAEVCDNKFKWWAIKGTADDCTFVWNGTALTHTIVRCDHTSRDNRLTERMMTEDDTIVKDGKRLKYMLDRTQDSDLMVIATWNDLGEGTGVNRAIDYWWDGDWREPTYFMDIIRASQAGMRLTAVLPEERIMEEMRAAPMAAEFTLAGKAMITKDTEWLSISHPESVSISKPDSAPLKFLVKKATPGSVKHINCDWYNKEKKYGGYVCAIKQVYNVGPDTIVCFMKDFSELVSKKPDADIHYVRVTCSLYPKGSDEWTSKASTDCIPIR